VYNPLSEVRRGIWKVRDVQNVAAVLVDPEGSLERRNHWEKTSHSLLVGAFFTFSMPNRTRHWRVSPTFCPIRGGRSTRR
jgi:type IV secretion system protein VirD4